MAEQQSPQFEQFVRYIDDDDRAGEEFLRRLGDDGLERLYRQVEADYTRATASLSLSGRDLARIAALAATIARDSGVTSPEGEDTVAKLVAIGWLMARWYQGD